MHVLIVCCVCDPAVIWQQASRLSIGGYLMSRGTHLGIYTYFIVIDVNHLSIKVNITYIYINIVNL